jgi:integrase
VVLIHFGQECCSKGNTACGRQSRYLKENRMAYFRHTYATLLVANGENVKVVQELMRHASTRFTLEIYSQAQLIAKRAAQQRLVEAILPEGVADSPPSIVVATAAP